MKSYRVVRKAKVDMSVRTSCVNDKGVFPYAMRTGEGGMAVGTPCVGRDYPVRTHCVQGEEVCAYAMRAG